MKQLLTKVAVANFVLFTTIDSFDICQPSFSKLPVVISLLNINCNDILACKATDEFLPEKLHKTNDWPTVSATCYNQEPRDRLSHLC